MTNKIIDKDIFRIQEFVIDSPKVIFIFTAMGTKIGLYRFFVKLMNLKGYTCIIYDYPLDLLFKAKLDTWENFYEKIITDAQKRLELLKEKGAKEFCAYGVSMGTLIANKFARDTPTVSHLILNLTYGDVAQNIWTFKGVKKTKQSLIEQGVTKNELRNRIHYVDPILNASKLKDKKVLLYLSKRDRVLVYDQTQHTRQAFIAENINFEYVENKYLGHLFGGAKNMLAINRLVKFLSEH